MKRFLYCESTEGGMDHGEFRRPEELSNLLGWMVTINAAEDSALVNWMETAQVGEYTTHRLGLCVRLKDEG